jgi:hypothetical protein
MDAHLDEHYYYPFMFQQHDEKQWTNSFFLHIFVSFPQFDIEQDRETSRERKRKEGKKEIGWHHIDVITLFYPLFNTNYEDFLSS